MEQTGLGLYITKNLDSITYNKSNYIKFAVVNLNNSKEYPLNFLCVLPRNINPNAKMLNKFQEKFGSQSQEIAKNLLEQELKTTEDQDIKNEINERLRLLYPKPKNVAKCNGCGKDFEYRKYNYGRQKTCRECRNKKRPNQEWK